MLNRKIQNHWFLVDLWWFIFNWCVLFLNRSLPFMHSHDEIWGTPWYANQCDHWATAHLSNRNTTSSEGRLFDLFNRKSGLRKPVQSLLERYQSEFLKHSILPRLEEAYGWAGFAWVMKAPLCWISFTSTVEVLFLTNFEHWILWTEFGYSRFGLGSWRNFFFLRHKATRVIGPQTPTQWFQP